MTSSGGNRIQSLQGNLNIGHGSVLINAVYEFEIENGTLALKGEDGEATLTLDGTSSFMGQMTDFLNQLKAGAPQQ